MEKGNSESSPNPPELNMQLIRPKKLKHRKRPRNILIYLINREMGMPRNNMNLMKWVWRAAKSASW
ncbi:embryonic testis differentiation protein-like [Nannospalax galili]|uniref:embryonic testis differentiation protein-like n=1 Tax=Nannospalax galili TaxID=1026970 RepID=UPI00111C9397|nr:embryonic testis differentiation protein-like [Nannospalax galili]